VWRVRGLSRISLSYNVLPLFSADASIYVSFSPSYLQKGFRHIYRDTACFRASQPTHARLARNIADTDVQQALDTIAVILDEP